MPATLRYALCNEVYEKRPFPEVCRSIRKAGFAGIEIAPFTLEEDPGTISAARRKEYRAVIESEGLIFAGLHWLMVSPKGLHVTTPDKGLRERSWENVRKLVDLCADLGPDGVMVFGSPVQRGSTGGISGPEATRNYVDGLAGIAPHALSRGVTVLVEALSPKDTDVVTSLDEAAAIVRQIGSPAIQTMFDSHNAIAEREPHATLVDRHFDVIRHVHVNELDGGYPGSGNYDFTAVFSVLARRGFKHWVSAEVFDFKPGADLIAVETLRHLEAEAGKVQ